MPCAVEALLDELGIWRVGHDQQKPISILVGNIQRSDVFQEYAYVAKIYTPLGIDTDEWENEKAEIAQEQETDLWTWIELEMADEKVPVYDQAGKAWLLHVTMERSWNCHTVKWSAKVTKQSKIVYLPPRNDQGLRVFECFAGGVGGWKRAVDVLRPFMNMPVTCIGLDNEWSAVQMYAASHTVKVWDAESTHLHKDTFQAEDEGIIYGDVKSSSWLPGIAAWRPQITTISAPCQAWSGAGARAGLQKATGQAFATSVIKARIIAPQAIAMENVPGIRTHKDFTAIKKMIRWAGYEIAYQKIGDLAQSAATIRARWLAIALRQDQRWPKTLWQEPKITRETPQTLGVIVKLPDRLQRELKIENKVLQQHGDPQMLPKKRRHETDPIQARSFQANQQIPTFMASYEHQRELPRFLLEQKGLMSHWLQEESGNLRWWDPLENATHHERAHLRQAPKKRSMELRG